MEKTTIHHKAGVTHFIYGISSAFNLFGNSETRIGFEDFANGPGRDAAALRGDWSRVGMDIKFSMEKMSRELQS